MNILHREPNTLTRKIFPSSSTRHRHSFSSPFPGGGWVVLRYFSSPFAVPMWSSSMQPTSTLHVGSYLLCYLHTTEKQKVHLIWHVPTAGTTCIKVQCCCTTCPTTKKSKLRYIRATQPYHSALQRVPTSGARQTLSLERPANQDGATERLACGACCIITLVCSVDRATREASLVD